MKTETVESLLLDRALGALTPEVGELLDDYLAQAPTAAARAAALADHVALARRAVAEPSRPAIGAPRWRPAPVTTLGRFRLGEWARLAACLAVGALAGWALARRPATQPELAKPTVATASVAPARPFQLGIVTAPRSAATARSYHLEWDSPIKMPRLEKNP